MAKYMTELGLMSASRARLAIRMHTGPKRREFGGVTEIRGVIIEPASRRAAMGMDFGAPQSAGGDPHDDQHLFAIVAPSCRPNRALNGSLKVGRVMGCLSTTG